MWFGVIIATVVAAAGVSFATNTDPDDLAPTGDTAAFCTAVKTFREQTASISLNPETPDADLDRFRASFGQVQKAAPPEIATTVDALATGTLDRTIALAREYSTRGTALEVVSEHEARMVGIDNETKRTTLRYANYVRRACGIDLDQPVPGSLVPEAPPAQAPSGVTPSSVPGPSGIPSSTEGG